MEAAQENIQTVAKIDDGLDRKTLFVRSIPFEATSEQLSDFFSQFAPIRHAVVVTDNDKKSRGFGFVKFTTDEDLLNALERAKKEKFLNRLLNVDVAKRRERQERTDGSRAPRAPAYVKPEEVEKRKARLIIRNLPWSVRDPTELKNLFNKFGAVTDAIIPRKAGGRMSGFAFITMKKKSAADKAIAESKGLKIHGREVVVDFAVEKSKWVQHNEDKEADESEDEEESDQQEEEEEEEEEEEGDEEEVPEEESDSEKEHTKKSQKVKKVKVIASDQNSDSETGEDSEDESDMEGVKDIYDNDDEEENRPKANRQEKFTIFIRNLPYDATEESLREHFSKFGPVRYALPVIERETGLAKGTGFVAFYKQESYEECLLNAPEATGGSILIADDVSPLYVYEGRVLSVAPAVDRDSANKLAERNLKNRKELLGKAPGEKDKRNLFLLNEGRITSNSKLAKLLTSADLAIREKSYDLRVQQLNKNPTLHLSLTRLALRNLPRALTEKSLKALGRKAIVEFATEVRQSKRHALSAEEIKRSISFKKFTNPEEDSESNRSKKKGVVRQAKVITEVKGSGEAGRSRGYGFLEFRDHKSALMALRWLNAHLVTNEEIVDGLTEEEKKSAQLEGVSQRRLIVEFAIENAKVMQRRKEFSIKSRDSRKRQLEAEEENAAKKAKIEEELRKSGVSDSVKQMIGKKRKARKNNRR
ncbi:unnamed protein product [Kuraishia capsulata CBS 1993]|uniref:RRM domain-containing protein n=1 Tax=Kuraishia capsulata CBS 1993 TaxID=1382522 RepID=W6MK39_9ASCO|nr:uncharacterized protein KUCA_T00002660001 [Kuraishia capsulata CBS 1993]CDK26686.1 unnamed protein product [Kuraishia capsulata CBS 1993]